MSARKQRILLWWFWLLMLVMGVGYWPLMWMFPPPDPSWSAEQVSIWFQEHRSRILLGAMCCAWSSAWFIQLGVVLWAQIRRVERGVPIWATLALVSSAVGTVTIVLPAVLWGAAAFSAQRAPEITQALHETAALMYVTSDMFYIGAWVAVVVTCFQRSDVPHSPFPRWFGWVGIWSTATLEMGALAFVFKTGPFAWVGMLAWWLPIAAVYVWMVAFTPLLLRALKAQEREEDEREQAEGEQAGAPALNVERVTV